MTESSTDSDRQLAYNAYQEHRRVMVETAREQARLFDKALLTLAAGAFGFSLTFIGQVVKDASPVGVRFLIASWCFFIVSLVTTLVGLLASQQGCLQEIRVTEAEWFENEKGQAKCVNKWRFGTSLSNWLSMGMFAVGATLLATFGALNVLR